MWNFTKDLSWMTKDLTLELLWKAWHLACSSLKLPQMYWTWPELHLNDLEWLFRDLILQTWDLPRPCFRWLETSMSSSDKRDTCPKIISNRSGRHKGLEEMEPEILTQSPECRFSSAHLSISFYLYLCCQLAHRLFSLLYHNLATLAAHHLSPYELKLEPIHHL